ncbi:aldehyde dehydrogenase family protein [Streptomyces sp. NPDC054933]
MPDYRYIYIDGSWTPSRGKHAVTVVNPATEEPIGHIPSGVPEDVDAAVHAARNAFEDWWHTPVERRADYLSLIAERMRHNGERLAELITRDVGTPLQFSRMAQVGLPINSFRHAAETACACPFERREGNSLIAREPFGVVGAITPWNYPLHQAAAKVAYALAAGNTVVLKPSEVAPLAVWELAEIMDSVGLPPGVFNLVSGTGPVIGEALAEHPDVAMVSFTGSTRAGKRVSELAARTVKRVALELGGKSPTIMLPDADPDKVVPSAVAAAFVNCGQTCSALTRLIVPRDTLARTERVACQVAESIRMGNPAAAGTQLGPLVSSAQRDRVRGHVMEGMKEGAKLIVGGPQPPDEFSRGYFVRPTVFSEVTPQMTLHQEEIFGPVLAIEPYDSVDEAVHLANDTVYGLAAAVWSADRERALAVARRIRAGQIEVNGGAFNPNAPFGGFKQSGNGREYGRYGLEEFLEIKSIQL